MSIFSLLQTNIPRAAIDELSKERINAFAETLPEDKVDKFYETANQL